MQQPVVKSEPRADFKSYTLKPGDTVQILSSNNKAFATGTIKLVDDSDICAGVALGPGYVGVGDVRLGTKKAEEEGAAATVFWRSDSKVGITQGQTTCNFKSKKVVESPGVVVPIPQERVLKTSS